MRAGANKTNWQGTFDQVPVIVRLDVMLARRKVKSRDLVAAVGITQANLSLLKSGKVRGIRFSTLAAICRYLECTPGDILDYEASENDIQSADADEGI